jgi:hypothetical protein
VQTQACGTPPPCEYAALERAAKSWGRRPLKVWPLRSLAYKLECLAYFKSSFTSIHLGCRRPGILSAAGLDPRVASTSVRWCSRCCCCWPAFASCRSPSCFCLTAGSSCRFCCHLCLLFPRHPRPCSRLLRLLSLCLIRLCIERGGLEHAACNWSRSFVRDRARSCMQARAPLLSCPQPS